MKVESTIDICQLENSVYYSNFVQCALRKVRAQEPLKITLQSPGLRMLKAFMTLWPRETWKDERIPLFKGLGTCWTPKWGSVSREEEREEAGRQTDRERTNRAMSPCSPQGGARRTGWPGDTGRRQRAAWGFAPSYSCQYRGEQAQTPVLAPALACKDSASSFRLLMTLNRWTCDLLNPGFGEFFPQWVTST